jgi:hypothetical protein
MGATPPLLERLAYSESSYNQFKQNLLTQPTADKKCDLVGPVSGLWPNENGPNPSEDVAAGNYIGLMQAKNSELVAWNWTENAQMGAQTFSDSIRIANKHENKIRSQDTLPSKPLALRGTQIEQLAVGTFKSFADPTWYWAPRCSVDPAPQCPYTPRKGNYAGGSWSWILNPCPCTHNRSATDTTDPKCPTEEHNVIVQVDKVIGSSSTPAACEK